MVFLILSSICKELPVIDTVCFKLVYILDVQFLQIYVEIRIRNLCNFGML